MNLQLKSPGKINLFLRVHHRRPDGYHHIQTAMAKLAFADTIHLDVSRGDRISLRVPGHPELENDSNLAVKAARLYLEKAQVKRRIEIQIDKHLPVAAGVGGGSSNGASTLLGLSRLMEPLDSESLYQIGLSLGADVPFFLHPASFAFATGIGEELTAWPVLDPRILVLVNPGFAVSAREAYEVLARPLTSKGGNGNSIALPEPPKNWRDVEGLMGYGNDLQAPIEQRYPEIRQIAQRLSEQGALFVRMTGSGPTVFGIFSARGQAEQAARSLPEKWARWISETCGAVE